MQFLRFCAGVALSFCLAVGGSGSAFAVSDIQTFRLENGLTVLIKEDRRFPLVSVRLFVKAGSAWEKPEEAGMSHLLEHMVFKGSKTSGPGVDKRVENAGGSMNAYTSYDMTTYLTDLPAAKWKDAMTAVRDLAFDPLLRQEDLDAEREVVIAEKKQRGDNPVTKLFQKALAHTLKGTPYESPVIGNEKALRGVTPDMMRDYIRRHYDPRDMVLSVAGDISAGDVVEEAKLLFGSYVNHNVRRMEPSIDPETLRHGLTVDVEKGPWDKAFLSLSFPLPGMRHELLPAADVLAHLLAGDDTAILPVRFRIEKPVVDSVNASAMTFERAGTFFVIAQLDADKVEEFLRDMGRTFATLKASDFSDEALARARINLEDNYLRGLENIASIAETMGSEYFYDPASLGGERYLAAVRGVSRDDIQQVLDLWLRPEGLTIAALVPEKAGKTALRNAPSSNSYNSGPNSYNNGPNSYNNGPNSHTNGPNSYNNGPNSHTNGPSASSPLKASNPSCAASSAIAGSNAAAAASKFSYFSSYGAASAASPALSASNPPKPASSASTNPMNSMNSSNSMNPSNPMNPSIPSIPSIPSGSLGPSLRSLDSGTLKKEPSGAQPRRPQFSPRQRAGKDPILSAVPGSPGSPGRSEARK